MLNRSMPARARRRPRGKGAAGGSLKSGRAIPRLPGQPDRAGRQRGSAVVPPPGGVDGAAYVLDVGGWGALEHVAIMPCSYQLFTCSWLRLKLHQACFEICYSPKPRHLLDHFYDTLGPLFLSKQFAVAVAASEAIRGPRRP